MSSSGLELPTASLRGKTAVVTGGGRGIGKAIALQLVRKGLTNLAITYVSSQTTAEETVAKCLELGAEKAITIKADIMDPEIGPKLIAEVTARLDTNTVDIVVNNAAHVDMRMNTPFAQTTAESFNKVMQGNCFSAMSVINAALAHLPARNGRIISISSVASREATGDPLMTYGASKAALESITRSLAMNIARKYLATFNTVSVGATRTEAMEKAREFFSQEFIDGMAERSSAEKRVGEPEDVAMIVAWLASEESRWINGASVMANGGDRGMIPVQG